MINVDQELQEIQKLRETKGSETETLKKIDEFLPTVVDENNFAILAKLYFEKAFVHQHLVMSHQDEANNLKLMEESALKAHDIIVKQNLTDLLGDDTRFLGRVYDYKKDYPQAFNFYQQALSFYQKQNHPRVLEINAFICANLINQSKIEEGLALAKKTYVEFDNNPLKQSDFYTWTVWKTGIYPRVVNALATQGQNIDQQEIKNILLNDQKLLSESGLDFRIRLDEINEVLNLCP
ncbi:MAG: hypothetical protein WC069_03005 [Candidatus Shapirobacteria bacterium]